MKMMERVSGVLSIGVGDNNDADFELAQRGLTVHAWDHTVNKIPREHELITFHSIGVGQESSENIKTLAELTELSFGLEGSDLMLLVDAEGSEWNVLLTSSDETLARFCILSVEVHGLGDALIPGSKVLKVLGRLRERFTPVAVHANNHGAIGEEKTSFCQTSLKLLMWRMVVCQRMPVVAIGPMSCSNRAAQTYLRLA